MMRNAGIVSKTVSSLFPNHSSLPGILLESNGIFLEYLWNLFRISLESLWNLLGIFLESLWNLFGSSLTYLGDWI